MYAHKTKTHMLRYSHTRQQGERRNEEGSVLHSCTEFVNTRVGRTAVHNIPYNGPTIQKETTAAVFHVKSALNAGGGSDIVTGLEGGVSLGPHTLSIPHSRAMTPFAEETYDVMRTYRSPSPKGEGGNGWMVRHHQKADHSGPGERRAEPFLRRLWKKCRLETSSGVNGGTGM